MEKKVFQWDDELVNEYCLEHNSITMAEFKRKKVATNNRYPFEVICWVTPDGEEGEYLYRDYVNLMKDGFKIKTIRRKFDGIEFSIGDYTFHDSNKSNKDEIIRFGYSIQLGLEAYFKTHAQALESLRKAF